MQIVTLDPKNPPPLPKHALTIGNFDGVHLGHQAMLTTLQNCGHHHHLKTAVMVFEPQPREFFNPNNPPARLSSFDEKAELIQSFGVDFLIKAKFDDDFRTLSAQSFGDILQSMNAKRLVLGDDFAFGHDRIGNQAFLTKMGFMIESLPTVLMNGERISSTAVRQALTMSDLQSAKRLLGRDYAITGKVVHGDKIGRTLNFPTANVQLNRLKPAVSGVFGADVFIYKDGQMVRFDAHHGVQGSRPDSLFGAVSVGTRPSVHGQEYRLEVHLPEFEGDLYDLTLTVIFTHHLHPEIHYPNIQALKAGIAKDIELLRKLSLSANG